MDASVCHFVDCLVFETDLLEQLLRRLLVMRLVVPLADQFVASSVVMLPLGRDVLSTPDDAFVELGREVGFGGVDRCHGVIVGRLDS